MISSEASARERSLLYCAKDHFQFVCLELIGDAPGGEKVKSTSDEAYTPTGSSKHCATQALGTMVTANCSYLLVQIGIARFLNLE